MDSFRVGPLTFKYTYLFLLTSLYIAYVMLDHWLNRYPDKKNIIYNTITNCLIIIFLTFKFSYILYRPSILWENPIGILYFTGGKNGLIIGVILSLFYLIYQFKVHQLYKWNYLKPIVYGFVTFIMSYYIVQTIFSLLI